MSQVDFLLKLRLPVFMLANTNLVADQIKL